MVEVKVTVLSAANVAEKLGVTSLLELEEFSRLTDVMVTGIVKAGEKLVKSDDRNDGAKYHNADVVAKKYKIAMIKMIDALKEEFPFISKRQPKIDEITEDDFRVYKSSESASFVHTDKCELKTSLPLMYNMSLAIPESLEGVRDSVELMLSELILYVVTDLIELKENVTIDKIVGASRLKFVTEDGVTYDTNLSIAETKTGITKRETVITKGKITEMYGYNNYMKTYPSGTTVGVLGYMIETATGLVFIEHSSYIDYALNV